MIEICMFSYYFAYDNERYTVLINPSDNKEGSSRPPKGFS